MLCGVFAPQQASQAVEGLCLPSSQKATEIVGADDWRSLCGRGEPQANALQMACAAPMPHNDGRRLGKTTIRFTLCP